MKTFGKVLGALMVLSGLVWILQGINLLPGSFMTGDPRWAVRGALLVVLGIILFVVASRRGPRSTPPPAN
jgi:uncharacterized membrane protein HdeD (DUF308 family)